MSEANLQAALETLQQHDVIHQTDQGYTFTVPLMRRWLRDYR